MDCAACHFELPANAEYCPACGRAVGLAVTGPTQRLTALGISRPNIAQGICPQCSAHTIFTDTDLDDYLKYRLSEIAISRHTLAVVTHYACTTCGYVESYLTDTEDLAMIRKNWTQIDSGQ